MKFSMSNVFGFILWTLICLECDSLNSDEEEARKFLIWHDEVKSGLCRKSGLTSWNFNTNVTEENQRLSNNAEFLKAQFEKKVWENITSYDWRNFEDPMLKRQFKLLSVLGISALPDDKLTEFQNVTSTMMSIYASTKICKFNDSLTCNLSLDPEITEIMEESRNYDELLQAWQQWHQNVGHRCKSLFKSYVRLGNEAAKLNNKHDLGDLWRHYYEDEQFEANLEGIWQKLKPLYQQLHAFVRKKLAEFYGEDKVSRTGPIPAHVLGNMWAQSWAAIYDLTVPFENVSLVDHDKDILNQNYTVNKMFHMADDFFDSLGMEKVPESFWNNSMFVKPDDGREVVCHASAWDLCNKKDVRIKMCTVVNFENLVTIHHEMGHIQYYMQYKDQPIPFREGANPGFHEAIGDTIALSVSSNAHLRVLNLVNDSDSREQELNYLFQTALTKIVFLPFGYAVDKWRWKVFSGQIPESNWNSEWWNIRKELQGIEPAIPRTSQDFDPPSKYHVAGDVEYARYFVAGIIQFQFHKALCTLAGQYNSTDPDKPLHRCDIFQNRDAGQLFSEVLKLGTSKPWPQTMELFTGEKEMNADAILEYFRPLMDFLEEDNQRTGEVIGW